MSKIILTLMIMCLITLSGCKLAITEEQQKVSNICNVPMGDEKLGIISCQQVNDCKEYMSSANYNAEQISTAQCVNSRCEVTIPCVSS